MKVTVYLRNGPPDVYETAWVDVLPSGELRVHAYRDEQPIRATYGAGFWAAVRQGEEPFSLLDPPSFLPPLRPLPHTITVVPPPVAEMIGPHLSPEFRYPAVGACIYCGAVEYEPGTGAKLHDEHIVPLGLGGNLLLREASCKSCEKTTGAKIEGLCLRLTLLHARIRYNFPTRNKRQRPTTFDIDIGEGPRRRTKQLLVEELPWISWVLPNYGLPGIISGARAQDCKCENVRAQVGAYDAERLLIHGAFQEPVGLASISFNIGVFERMLAKIAHSYAVAELGLDGFTPALKSMILDGHPHQAFWIGEERAHNLPGGTLYDLSLARYPSDGAEYLVVLVQLMGFLGTPVYAVVVGTLPDARSGASIDFARRELFKPEFQAPPGRVAVHPWTGDQLSASA